MALKNKKSLGQHWLKDREILQDIADFALSPEADFAIEIGPGLGTLTSTLLKNFSQVLAVEFDKRLAENLPKSFPGKNLSVINQDILSLDLSSLNLPEKYVVAGNIPYYITSPIIQKFLQTKHKPQKIVLLIQKEVAERLAAKPGDYSILGLSAQIYADVELGPVIDRDFFTPPPKVDSQIAILKPLEKPRATEATMALIRLGFSSPRKKILNNLSASFHLSTEDVRRFLEKCDIDPSLRPADLTIDDWLRLEKVIKER